MADRDILADLDAPFEGRRSAEPGESSKSEDQKGGSRERDMRGGSAPFRCYNCNQPGHLARDCPEKPRNPLYADTRGTKISDLGKARPERFHPYERNGDRGGGDRYERRGPPPYYSSRGGPRYGREGSPRRMEPYREPYMRPRSPEPRGRSPPREYRGYPKDYSRPIDGFRRMDYPMMDRRPGPDPYYRGGSPGRHGRDYGRRSPPYHERDYRGPPPMDYHSRSPVRGSADAMGHYPKGDVGQHYRPRTPERFQNDYHDRMRDRPSDHLREKSPDRSYPPGSYPSRARSPQSFDRRGGFDFPPRDDRFARGPPRGVDPRLDSRDPRMDRDPRADRTDSRMDGGRGDSRVERTDERPENLSSGGSSVPVEKQRMHTP